MPYDKISMIQLCHEDKEPAIVFINGFLQENDTTFDGWREPVKAHFPDNTCYGLAWPSNSMWPILAEAQQKAKTPMPFKPLKKMANVSKTFTDAWNDALEHAADTGKALAGWLVHRDKPTILMGHSLGARIIHHALVELKEKNSIMTRDNSNYLVHDIYLFGGAISSELEEWKKLENTFSGTLYNIFSEKDNALKRVYYFLTKGEEAVGISEIELVQDSFFTNIPLPDSVREYFQEKRKTKEEIIDLRIINFDASEFVEGHTKYKGRLHDILAKLREHSHIVHKS